MANFASDENIRRRDSTDKFNCNYGGECTAGGNGDVTLRASETTIPTGAILVRSFTSYLYNFFHSPFKRLQGGHFYYNLVMKSFLILRPSYKSRVLEKIVFHARLLSTNRGTSVYPSFSAEKYAPRDTKRFRRDRNTLARGQESNTM